MQKNSIEITDEILFAEGEEHIRACYPVMRQLRPPASLLSFQDGLISNIELIYDMRCLMEKK